MGRARKDKPHTKVVEDTEDRTAPPRKFTTTRTFGQARTHTKGEKDYDDAPPRPKGFTGDE